MLREPSALVHSAKICPNMRRISGLRPTTLRILASEWVAARIGRSEMGEGPTNPMPRLPL
jgi:hypothetical protein